MLRNFYVPDYVTVIRVLGSGTNEGLSPRSGRGRPPSLVPTPGNLNRNPIRSRFSDGKKKEDLL